MTTSSWRRLVVFLLAPAVAATTVLLTQPSATAANEPPVPVVIGCPGQTEQTWYHLPALANVAPGDADVAGIAGALAGSVVRGYCRQVLGGAVVPTARYLAHQDTSFAVEGAKLNALQARAAELQQVTESYGEVLANPETAEPAVLVEAFRQVSEAARTAEVAARAVGWQGTPAVLALASVKHAALVGRWELAEPGSVERLTADALVRNERAATLAAVQAGEEEYRHLVKASGLTRRARVERLADPGGTELSDVYSVYASASLGDTLVYEDSWECTTSWPAGEGTHADTCAPAYEAKRSELFGTAMTTHENLRRSLTTALAVRGYLAAKTTWGHHSAYVVGAPVVDSFYLVNNSSSATPWCMGAAAAAPAPVTLRACEFGDSVPAGQLQRWRFRPGGTGLEHVSSGQCLTSTSPILVLGACPSVTNPVYGEFDPAAWSMHPLGHLKQLATNRCAAPVALTQGASIAAPDLCDYDRSSQPNGLDAPTAASGYDGIWDTDPLTNDFWHLRAVEAPPLPTHTLRVQVDGVGTVASAVEHGVACGDTGTVCEVEVPAGSTVALKATPAPGHEFSGWGAGPCTTAGRTCTVALEQDLVVPAYFAPEPAPEPTPTTTTAAATSHTYGQSGSLAVAVSPSATGQVRTVVAGRTFSAQLAGGRAVQPLPARLLPPGRYPVSVHYDGVEGVFGPSATTATLTVLKARPRVRVVALTRRPRAGRVARFEVLVVAPGISPTGAVRLRVGGTRGSAVVPAGGRVVVAVKLRKSLKAGRKVAVVTYAGNRHLTEASARVRIVSRR